MELKKSKNAEIESHRGTWLLMGFIAVLSFMFVAFEWAQYDKQIDTSTGISDLVFTADLIPIMLPEKVLPPPPPMAAATDKFEIAPDEADIEKGTVLGTEATEFGIEVKHVPKLIEEEAPVELPPLDYAEVMPAFPGGTSALNAFLAKNIKYPTLSIETGSQGRVIVQFIVDKDGSITNAMVVRGVDPHLDREALRVINSMPKWSPGRQAGVPVRVKYTVPVVFKLQ